MLEVNFDGLKYVARLSFDMKPVVQAAPFFWDAGLKKYISHDHKAAYRLIDYATPQTRKYILDQLGLAPLNPDFTKITWPEGKKPFLHQIEFVKWAMSRRASYIAGEAGTGKTPAAVMCMNAEPGPSIIVCPAFLALNWAAEIEAWTTWKNKPQIDIVQGQKHFFDEKADIYIVPASVVHVDRIREFFFESGRRFKWLFIDEAHYFKNPEVKRTQSVLGGRVLVGNKKKVWKGLHHISDHVVDMSGTPMPNGRPLELFPVLSKHAPHVIGYLDKHRYALRYCDAFEGEWGWDYTGASNLEEFNARLNKDFMLTKRLEECVDLPPKMPAKFLYLEDDRGAKLIESEMKILNEVSLDEIIKAEMLRDEAYAEKISYATASMGDNVFVSGGFQFLSELRKRNGLRKVDQSLKVLKEIIEDKGEVVVFAWHKEVVHLLADGLAKYEPFVITGETAMKKRHASVQEFQKSNSRNVFVANIEAAGVGLTLTKAATVVFVEPSWVPGQNDQAINRLYRITQTRSVQPIFLVWKNSLDHMILNAHQHKNRKIDKGIYGK